MIGSKSVLALIPARGGSKGLPGKNIRSLCGKPLIAWSIEQGRASRYLDAVVVSTDDDVIARTAREHGAEVPFLRPAELASDEAPTIDVIVHALDVLFGQERQFDILVLLEPTSPLREASDIDAMLEALVARSDVESVVGVARAESAHPAFLVKLEKGLIRPYAPTVFGVKRRQDLDEVFFLAGSVYASYTTSLRKRRGFYHEATLSYIVPKHKSFEVDELADFVVVEALMAARIQGVFQ
jgi:CMP-N,N'-diacetyllegionaminic acid synthase